MSVDPEQTVPPDSEPPVQSVGTGEPGSPAVTPSEPPASQAAVDQTAALREAAEPASPASDAPSEAPRKPRIKIGTQRPGVAPPRLEPRTQVAYRATAVENKPTQRAGGEPSTASPQAAAEEQPGAVSSQPREDQPVVQRKPGAPKSKFDIPAPPGEKVEPPNLRQALSPELEAELAEALGEQTLDELIAAETGGPPIPEGLEPESHHRARVVRVFRDNVFVELGGRNQGVLSLHQLPAEPEIGAEWDVVVLRFNVEEGLYELVLSGASVEVGDWSDLAEGIVVDARITGHNKGGLECEVNKIRGFIPAGQISIYRVENFEEFVGQTWPCLVMEANPQRRNLVLSRRAILEREQAEAKQRLLEELQVGDVREGIVRSVRDFGAFVDLGGVDGMIHVSQLSWDRIKHPSEVMEVGQRVKVKIQKIDLDKQKISLAYRDLFESPWTGAATKYPVTTKVKGTVSKIMDFGAFVKLEPGVEGLVHISELSHKRVFRVSDVVQEGQEIEAKVLSVDSENQRISLSMKALEARPEPAKKTEPEQPPEPEAPAPSKKKQRKQPLQGGLGRSPKGKNFGLRW